MNEVDTNILNTLFEEPIPAPIPEPTKKEDVKDDADIAVPVSKDGDEIEVTPDTIIDALQIVDEMGHTKAAIIADLSRLHNLDGSTTLDSIPEDDREYIDQIVIENATFDMYSLDGKLFNIILRFDNAKDAYMKELNEMLNRYRAMQEQIANDGHGDMAALFTLTLMPDALNGYGVMNAMFPVSYFRILDDNGVNASFLLQFDGDNLEFLKLEMTEDERNEITADVMRENGTSGSLFEEAEE